jgi:DNA polymerase
MQEIILDYETTSSANLKVVGPTKYAKDPSTAIVCVGFKIDNAPSKIWIPERGPCPPDLWLALKNGATIVAHNAGFEKAITNFVLPRYYKLTLEQIDFFRTLPIERFKCTAAKAANCSLPRGLDPLCQALDLPIKKDMEGNRLMKKYMKPRKPSLHNPATRWDDKWELRRIYKYCLVDLEAEYLVNKRLPDLTPSERAVWELDNKVNSRGIRIDVPLVHLILEMIAEEKSNIKKAVQELSDGEIESATQTAKVLKWINGILWKTDQPVMANLRAPTIRDRLESTALPKRVRMMLLYRQSASKTSLSKYRTMLRVVDDEDHRARDLILYGGAVPTMRFSGMRLQPQNFPRPVAALIKQKFSSDEAIRIIKTKGLQGIKDKYGAHLVMDVFAACTRGMLIASEGCELFDADFSSVEARLAFWFAEHEDGLKAFRDKRKLYEEMAAATFGCDIAWLLTDEGKISIERFVGKESILGCQYGMGNKKFLSQCHQKGMKMVTPEMAKKAVNTYREVHWPVPQAWKNLDVAIIAAIKKPGTYHKTNRVKIWVKDDFLLIKLPSGRKLKYFKPRVSNKQLGSEKLVPEIRYWAMDWYTDEETGKQKRGFTEVVAWGGIFFNHICQGCARDFMVNSIKNIDDAGFDFLLGVHDEAIAEHEKDLYSAEDFVAIMSMKPAWGESAPITAEGWKNERYRK